MKEVLFRGKTIDENKWIQGSLVRALGYLDEDEKFFIIPEDALYYNHGEFDFVKEVRSETVGQYTGLYDKFNRRIFENDIVRVCEDDGNEFCKGFVYFDKRKGTTYVKSQRSYRTYVAMLTSITEVIGNIHDNPNLLDEVKE